MRASTSITGANSVEPAAGDRVADERRVLGAADRDRADQRQRHLALGEIVAEVLADRREVARVVEHVVDELERVPRCMP